MDTAPHRPTSLPSPRLRSSYAVYPECEGSAPSRTGNRLITRKNRCGVYSGGPARVMPGSSRTIACDVATGRSDEPSAGFQAIGIMLGAAQIMQAALSGRMLSAYPPDLLLRPPVERVRLLDFIYASRILATADVWKDTLKRELSAKLERSSGAESALLRAP